MGRTRLFQQAGSPLIQGRSRTQRPFWQEWVGGVVVAGLAAYAYEVAAALVAGTAASAALADSLAGAGVAVQIALPAAAAGAWFARRMGWRKAWAIGAGLALLGYAGLELWSMLGHL